MRFSNVILSNVSPKFISLIKVNNRNTRKICKICSKLTIKTPDRRHWSCGEFIVNFEYISRLFLVFLLLTLSLHLFEVVSEKTKWYYLNSTSCISVNATPTLWRSRLSTFPGMEELDVSFSRACPPVIEKLTCILIVKTKGWNISVLPCQTYSRAGACAHVSKKIWKYLSSLLLSHFSPTFFFHTPWKRFQGV